nr:MAG TPA: hypothetical protein [Caudoviricetes sp.]
MYIFYIFAYDIRRKYCLIEINIDASALPAISPGAF